MADQHPAELYIDVQKILARKLHKMRNPNVQWIIGTDTASLVGGDYCDVESITYFLPLETARDLLEILDAKQKYCQAANTSYPIRETIGAARLGIHCRVSEEEVHWSEIGWKFVTQKGKKEVWQNCSETVFVPISPTVEIHDDHVKLAVSDADTDITAYIIITRSELVCMVNRGDSYGR